MPFQSDSLRLTVLLGVLVALTALGTDLFLPAMPAIAQAFAAEVGAVQFTITAFFIGIAGGQLFWGPLSDRYGRRPALLAGLALFVAASLAAAAAQSVGGIALARFAQGLGMSSGPVVARAVVRDMHAHEQAARALARIMVVFGVIPIAAPLLGAEALAFGWQAVFWTLAAIALVLLGSVQLGLAETAPRERVPGGPVQIARNFAALLSRRRFLAPYAAMLCVQAGIFAFITNSAFVLVKALGLSPREFAMLFAAVMVGQISGAYISSRLVVRLGIPWMLRFGARLACASGLALAVLAWLGVAHWSAVVLPSIGYMAAASFVVPHATAAALTPFPRIAGSASSLMGASQFALGALVGTALGLLFDGTPRPMASAMALAGLAALALEELVVRPALKPA